MFIIRYIARLLVTTTFLLSGSAIAANYSDWWYEPAKSGTGFNIGHQGDKIFISGFLYDVDSEPTWVVIGCTLSNTVATGEVRAWRGPYYGGPFSATPVVSEVVGTGTITFSSEDTALLEFTINGNPISYNLSRFNFAPVALAGTFMGYRFESVSSCAQETFPDDEVDVEVVENGSAITIRIDNFFDGLCEFSGTRTQSGNGVLAQGEVRCEKNFDEGTWTLSSIRKVDEGSFFAHMNVSLTNRPCTYSHTFAWVDG